MEDEKVADRINEQLSFCLFLQPLSFFLITDIQIVISRSESRSQDNHGKKDSHYDEGIDRIQLEAIQVPGIDHAN